MSPQEVKELNCSNCNHENREGSRFCNQCGFPLQESKVTLGAYDEENPPRSSFFHRQEKSSVLAVEDHSQPFAGTGALYIGPEEIYDRDRKKRGRRSPFLRLGLVVVLFTMVLAGIYGVKYAVSTQEDRIAQAENLKAQKAQAEELQKLENYREKFNTVVTRFEEQGAVIQANIDSLTTLRINRFVKGLGLGDGFNSLVNKLFDVSQVGEMKESGETLDLLVLELVSPPKTFESKYEMLLHLQETESAIQGLFQGEVTSDTKTELEELNAEYQQLLTDIKR